MDYQNDPFLRITDIARAALTPHDTDHPHVITDPPTGPDEPAAYCNLITPPDPTHDPRARLHTEPPKRLHAANLPLPLVRAAATANGGVTLHLWSKNTGGADPRWRYLAFLFTHLTRIEAEVAPNPPDRGTIWAEIASAEPFGLPYAADLPKEERPEWQPGTGLTYYPARTLPAVTVA